MVAFDPSNFRKNPHKLPTRTLFTKQPRRHVYLCVCVLCFMGFFFHFECVRIYFRLVPYLLRFLSGHCTVINVEITHFKICIFFVFINAGMMYIAISYWLDFHMHIFILQYFFIENSIHSVIYFPICFRNIFIAKL